MKSRFLIPLFLLAILIVNVTTAQEDVTDTVARLGVILNQWHRDAANAYIEEYIGVMADEGVFIGTDAKEYWTKETFRAFCEPYFEKGTTWKFSPLSRTIYLNMEKYVAWFDELLNTQMGICRGSGVLQRYPDGWKIEQYVLSATIPNEQMKAVTRNKSVIDSALVLKSIFDRYGMDGTILIFDPRKNNYSGYNAALWDSGYLPASTFKIPNTMIGIETGVIDTGYIFIWNGEKRRLPEWNQDLSLRDAFRFSCVPCYQEVARKIGPEAMNDFLARLNYGNMDVHPDNIGVFWLEGDSRITPRQQVDFLRQLQEGTFPVRTSSMKTVKSIMLNEETQEYRLYGKTGWSIRDGNNYGWFVGWIETSDRILYVATLIEPKDQSEIRDFQLARKGITMEVLRLLDIIRE